MQNSDMNPSAADAIRAELSAIGTKGSYLQRRQRRGRAVVALAGLVVIAGATTGAAIAAINLPGSTTTAPLGTVTNATGTGPAFVDLGPVPKQAGSVMVTITCLNDVGTVIVATTTPGGGEGVACAGGRGRPIKVRDAQLPAAGSTEIGIASSPTTKWKVTAQYASSATSPWGVNASGQTYGVENQHGHPDLVPATADNGKKGYVFWQESMGAEKTTTFDVYESDGKTVIGHTSVEVGTGAGASVPLDPRLFPTDIATPTPEN
ncbi:hypothetical protein GCM10025867_36850 [Frondihabitans sucicola]|uniref:Uncharacterized protein n=1 Tax=Frondihabitans sucicola TaxID=1268041 RepID=A0ABN6Y304_9MICO|nr:hypothetical protein [Frondihabitans sucicola]BDZ51444.1 hypothetical protein GCM10025867_36850 [Frondihabitans sucicola]